LKKKNKKIKISLLGIQADGLQTPYTSYKEPPEVQMAL
jgi:hypothetical protein